MTSPGCTSSVFCSGLNCNGPRAFASNSMEILRLMSTCVFFASPAPTSRCTRLLMPVIEQIARYMGTSAKPKPNMAAATTISLTIIERLNARSSLISSGVDTFLPSGTHVLIDDHRREKHRGYCQQDQAKPLVARANLCGRALLL